MRHYLPAIILASFVSYSCRPDTEVDFASPAVYFIEFFDPFGSELSNELIEITKPGLIEYDYVLTEESGMAGWPYYLEVPRGSSFPKDSLAPPHTTIHILSLKEFDPKLGDQSFKVNVTLGNQNDSSFTVEVDVLKLDSNGELTIVANPPPYTFNLDRFETLDHLSDKLKGTIIRATFK